MWTERSSQRNLESGTVQSEQVRQTCVLKQQKLVGVSLREKQTQRSEENAGPRSGRAPREDVKKELNQRVKAEAG